MTAPFRRKTSWGSENGGDRDGELEPRARDRRDDLRGDGQTRARSCFDYAKTRRRFGRATCEFQRRVPDLNKFGWVPEVS